MVDVDEKIEKAQSTRYYLKVSNIGSVVTFFI